MKWLLGEGVLPMHCTMHTAHRTQETGHCHRQVIIALLVTDPPDANLNNLQNPPIGQTTTFKIHCQGWQQCLWNTHGYAQACQIHSRNLSYGKIISYYIYLFNQFCMDIVEHLCRILACNCQFYISAWFSAFIVKLVDKDPVLFGLIWSIWGLFEWNEDLFRSLKLRKKGLIRV